MFMAGKGFGFWNTMPIFLLMATGSTERSYRLLPSNMIFPVTFAEGTRSCIRFIERRSVDFPHPDGPIIAVTVFSMKARETDFTAWLGPKWTFIFSSVTFALFIIPRKRSCRGDPWIARIGRGMPRTYEYLFCLPSSRAPRFRVNMITT